MSRQAIRNSRKVKQDEEKIVRMKGRNAKGEEDKEMKKV